MKAQSKCQTRYCRNQKAPNRNICYKCKSRREKVTNPYGFSYQQLKNRAKQRGKEFTLTREEWKRFCDETNYLELKGNQWNKMTVDRKDHTKGYSYDNIQILSHSENSSKGNKEKRGEVPF